MAIARGNIALFGVSGKLGRQYVVRQRNGKTVICKLPKPYEKPPTPGQLTNRERFKAANDFAKAAIADPVKKAYYKSKAKEGQSAYNVAFKDAFHSTHSVEIIADVAENQVIVRIDKGLRPDKVKIAAVHDMGFEEETGYARISRNTKEWVYTFISDIQGKKIRIYLENDAGVVWLKEIIFR